MMFELPAFDLGYARLALAAVVLVNLATFIAFGWDKRRARNGLRRVPEFSLLLLALAGGSPAAKLAQRLFRHKTRKEPFRTALNGVIAAQVALALALLVHEPARSAAAALIRTLAGPE